MYIIAMHESIYKHTYTHREKMTHTHREFVCVRERESIDLFVLTVPQKGH